VVKHSQASFCTVKIRNKSNVFVLEVSDDGVGLPTDASARGHGTSGIRDRIQWAGGTAEWSSQGGTRLGEAGDGIEALALIEKKVPDLCLLDIEMPGMNGIEVAKKLKRGIAAEMFLSQGTARNYLSAAMDKFGAKNRMEAILETERKGWL